MTPQERADLRKVMTPAANIASDYTLDKEDYEALRDEIQSAITNAVHDALERAASECDDIEVSYEWNDSYRAAARVLARRIRSLKETNDALRAHQESEERNGK